MSPLPRTPRVVRATAEVVARTAGLVALGGLVTVTWGQVERRMPTVRRQVLTVPDPAGSLRPLTVLQIADLHMYPGQEHLVRFLQRVRDTEQFDFVVSTGDNLGDAAGLDLALRAHRVFDGIPGAFVLGSNDYYSPRNPHWVKYLGIRSKDDEDEDLRRHTAEPDLPWRELVDTLTSMGWTDLSNRSDITRLGARRIGLVGVDDPHIDRDRMPALPDGWSDPGVVRIGVSHAPYRRVLDRMTAIGADLILSGHTHGGQLAVPGFGALVTNSDLPRVYARGMHSWMTREGASMVNVSAGLGNSPFVPLRIGARPEVSLISIVPQH